MAPNALWMASLKETAEHLLRQTPFDGRLGPDPSANWIWKRWPRSAVTRIRRCSFRSAGCTICRLAARWCSFCPRSSLIAGAPADNPVTYLEFIQNSSTSVLDLEFAPQSCSWTTCWAGSCACRSCSASWWPSSSSARWTAPDRA